MNMAMFTSVQLYFFSGTGNARRITHWSLDFARQFGMPAKVVNIEKIDGRPATPLASELVGFIYPIHGFITIWAMLKFILLFPKNRNGASVFAITSLGGMKVGKHRIPGWEGSGLYLPMLILKLKGYRWAGAFPMRFTPENWTSLIPGYGERSSRYMLEACRPRLETFLASVFSGKRSLHGLISAAFGFAIIKISIMYLLVFRFFLAKTNFVSSACNGCGICANNCPVSAIKMVRERPYWELTCESCMRCMNFCSRKAVQAHLPFWFLIMALLIIPVSKKVTVGFGGNGTFGWLASYLAILVLLEVIYWIWFQLLRLRWVNRVFEYTAPTRYYTRYREPDTKLKDLRAVD